MALTGIVDAAKEKDTQTAGETAAKNMTYGQCVSEHAAIKNTCYVTVKDALAACKAQAAQDTATKKDATKQCKTHTRKTKSSARQHSRQAKKMCAQKSSIIS
ncbi:MAG: hypothetical protein QXD13_02200 [Candidatus Pacearchaeota archaeon]